MSVEGCLACDANAGRIEVPGGTIAETEHWHADHCIGPFGVGAVVVKTKEHVEDLWNLPDGAADELGPTRPPKQPNASAPSCASTEAGKPERPVAATVTRRSRRTRNFPPTHGTKPGRVVTKT